MIPLRQKQEKNFFFPLKDTFITLLHSETAVSPDMLPRHHSEPEQVSPKEQSKALVISLI